MLRGFATYLEKLEEALKNNKPPGTLFDVEPDWRFLKEDKCPICGNLLKKPREKSISICYGKRHGDKKKFIIKNSTLAKFKNFK